MRTIVTDEKPRPSWAGDDASWQRWEYVRERAMDYGFRAVTAGWSLFPRRRGEVRLVGKIGEAIVVQGTSPADAVEAADMLLSRLEDADLAFEEGVTRGR